MIQLVISDRSNYPIGSGRALLSVGGGDLQDCSSRSQTLFELALERNLATGVNRSGKKDCQFDG